MTGRKRIFLKSSIALLFLVSLTANVWASNGVTIPSNTGLPGGTLFSVIEGLMKWLLGIFGFLAIISFIITGIMYFMGGSMTGEKKDVSGAKKQMQWSIIGVIIGLSGYVIIKAVDAWLKGASIF